MSAARFFHTLIVMGGSISACGGDTSDDGANPRGDGNSTGPDAPATSNPSSAPSSPTASSSEPAMPIPDTSPWSCESFAQFTCDDYLARTGCRCEADNPGAIAECPEPWQFQCATELDDPPPGQQADVLVTYAQGVGCHCDPTTLAPSGCLLPHHYRCQSYYPTLRDCACDETAPSPDDDFICCYGEDWGCDLCATIR